MKDLAKVMMTGYFVIKHNKLQEILGIEKGEISSIQRVVNEKQELMDEWLIEITKKEQVITTPEISEEEVKKKIRQGFGSDLKKVLPKKPELKKRFEEVPEELPELEEEIEDDEEEDSEEEKDDDEDF